MESEAVLLRRFADSGDAEAFSEIARRHAGLVYGACIRILDDKTRAADAAQETFFQLVRHAGEITGSLPSWLHKVATGKAIDVIRRDVSRKQREAKYAADKPREIEKWEDMSQCVDESLDELDEDLKEILIQRFFEGRSMAEIAEARGISQPTVSRRVESGLGELRGKLRKRGIVIAVVTLSSLLGDNAAAAAPAYVLGELGKMALVSGATGVGTSAAGAGVKVVAGGLLTGVKAKVVTAVAVAVVGVGGVVTYQQVTREVGQPVAERPVEWRVEQRPARNTRTLPQPRESTYQAEVARESLPYPVAAEEDTTSAVVDEPAVVTDESSAAAPVGGYGGGGYGGSYRVSRRRATEEPNSSDSDAVPKR